MRRRNNASSSSKKKKGRSRLGASSSSSMKKRQQQQQKQRRQPTIQEHLQAAATAETAMDAEAAYKSYSQAYSQLVEAKSPPPTSDDSSGDVASNYNSNHQLMIIHILQKMGELQVSLNDPDTAKDHFVDAIQRLEASQPQQQQQQATDTMVTYYETHSSLCFYIGQSSLEHDGLLAYIKGIASLEECIRLVENSSNNNEHHHKQQQQNQNEDDCMESDDQDVGRPDQKMLLQELKEKLSGAYCNIAELYLTDLCEEENAESECERNLAKALQITDGTDGGTGGPYVDALQTMASLRLSQQHPVDRQLQAVPFILQAYEKQRVGSEALAALVGLSEKKKKINKKTTDGGDGEMEDEDETEEQAKELLEVDAANNLPEFEFRCQTAKLLLECAALLQTKREEVVSSNGTTAAAAAATAAASSAEQGIVELANEYFRQECQCISASISVLGSLLAQNDEIIEIWYLAGCAFAAKTPPSVDAATFYLGTAKEMLTKIRKSLEQDLEYVVDDNEREELQDELELNATQMQDVQAKLDELQTTVAEAGEDNDDDDDEAMEQD